MATEYENQVIHALQEVAYAVSAQTLLDLMMARQTSFFMKLPAADKQYVTDLVVKLKEKVDG